MAPSMPSLVSDILLTRIDDWASTFHKIPKLTDDLISERSGTRIAELGLTDVATGHISDDFDKWVDEKLWPGITKDFGGESDKQPAQAHGLDIEVEPSDRETILRQDVDEAVVIENKVLTAPEEPAKRHIELQLPKGM